MSKNDSLKVRFSIGAKLVLIITIIVLVSLGSIIALVSWLVRDDLRITAEANNFEVNRRSAMEAENTLAGMRSNSLLLMQTLAALGPESAHAKAAVDFFFDQNPTVAAISYNAGGEAGLLLANENFFFAKDIDPSLAHTYFEKQKAAPALKEQAVLNAAPHFGISALAFFFSWQDGAAALVFSPDNLNDVFGYGTNQSYLLNRDGDILVHSDFDLVRRGVNLAGRDFTRLIRENPALNSQVLFTDEEGLRYFGAYTKLNTAGCMVITNIEYDKVFEGIDRTTWRNIYLAILVLSFSVLLIWFFSKRISVPLKKLAVSARAIEGGEFNVELKPRGHDEVGVLTTSFQHMCSALGIFGRFTNKEIALRAMRGEIRPGGLPKNVTIFFSDIRGFTEKSEAFTQNFGEDASDRIVSWLNEYFSSMVEYVEKTGGVVDKFIGDALMAHWGSVYTSGSPANDAYNCIKAALMMRLALVNSNRKRSPGDPGNPPIRIGIGINTGIVTTGQIGSDIRMEYTVIGDPVNLASRVEALNKPLGTDILIAEDTWNLVQNNFITEEMPPVTVKGKEQPVRLFAVINLAGNKKGPQTLADVRELLGIKPPDVSGMNINTLDSKFKIGGEF